MGLDEIEFYGLNSRTFATDGEPSKDQGSDHGITVAIEISTS